YKIDAINSVLPVTLLNFTATLQSQDVKLDWSTSTEINSSHFIIQRSIDGTHFTDIGSVNAAGNSSIKKQYSYNDNEYLNAGADILYYRLQLVDIDGKFKYSGVLSVKLNGTVTNLEVYPNPVRDQLSVLFSSANENKIALRINDVKGRQMYYQTFISGNASNLQNINVSGFATGVYFVQMITGKEIKTVKFIKE
ncbi:MAG: T9SS type A sorting domain-containing protein, partial [Ginsengibacter sp.]